MVMEDATLNDLLTDQEKKSLFLGLYEIPLNKNISHLRIEQVNNLFLVLYWPLHYKMAAGTIVSMVWEELTNRAIEKKLPIFS